MTFYKYLVTLSFPLLKQSLLVEAWLKQVISHNTCGKMRTPRTRFMWLSTNTSWSQYNQQENKHFERLVQTSKSISTNDCISRDPPPVNMFSYCSSCEVHCGKICRDLSIQYWKNGAVQHNTNFSQVHTRIWRRIRA